MAKVRVVIPMLDFNRSGGNRVLSELATQLVDRGYEVDFVCLMCSDAPYFPTRAQVIWIDGNGRRVARNKPSRKTYPGQHLVALTRFLRRYGGYYDLVLANHSLTTLPTYLSGNAHRAIYYVQAYEPEYYAAYSDIRSRIARMISRRSYSLIPNVIVNAPVYFSYKEIHTDMCVPPGLDLVNYRPRRGTCQRQPGDPLILGCIGRKEVYKGTMDALVAFRAYKMRHGNCKLRVAIGHVPPPFDQDSSIEVVPIQSDAQLADFYRSLDIMIAPGTVQLGAVHYPVLEAMACGIPTVHTGYAPGSSENSWIVSPHSPDQIVSAIEAIVDNKVVTDTRVQKGLVEVARYAWHCVGAELDTCIRRVIARRDAAPIHIGRTDT